MNGLMWWLSSYINGKWNQTKKSAVKRRQMKKIITWKHLNFGLLEDREKYGSVKIFNHVIKYIQ